MRKAPNCSRLLTGKMQQKHLDDCGLQRDALQGTKAYPAVAAACASRTAEGGDARQMRPWRISLGTLAEKLAALRWPGPLVGTPPAVPPTLKLL
eukprot:9110131-Alexandrium_andersonii.AAC.1